MMEFICKSCGGSLSFLNDTICECEYCGLRQTVPKADSEHIGSLYNHANESRLKKRYDQALSEYQAITQEKPDHAEAYWGIVLCRYGIEYVEDYDGSMKPTIHRMQYDSILNDDDYLKAIHYSDVVTKEEYKREAEEIATIQNKISAAMSNEEPYDVFISYKEKDDDTGLRTIDSATAKMIYDELTSQDYRVFYSRVSLKKAIGEDYEARIFAALHSAKVMILVSSKLEYANAVWVKNEWQRYLQLMQKDHSKHMLTVFRGNPGDCVPNVLAQMQGQNAAEPAAEKYIAEGVEKYIGKRKQQQFDGFQRIVKPDKYTEEELLQQGFSFLEKGGFDAADGIFNEVLKTDTECPRAYLGKLMVEKKVKNQYDLAKCEESFERSSYYIKILRYGDAKLVTQLKEYLQEIYMRNKLEEAREILDTASTIEECLEANSIVESLKSIESTDSLPGIEQFLNTYNTKTNQIINSQYEEALAFLHVHKYKEAHELFIKIAKYENDQSRMSKYFDDYAKTEYSYAVELQEQKKYQEAAEIFAEIDDYFDSKERIQTCKILVKKEEERNNALKDFRDNFQKKYGYGVDAYKYYFAECFPNETDEYYRLRVESYNNETYTKVPLLFAVIIVAVIATILSTFGFIAGVPLIISNTLWVICVCVFISNYGYNDFSEGCIYTAWICGIYYAIHLLSQVVSTWKFIGPAFSFLDSYIRWVPIGSCAVGLVFWLKELRKKLRSDNLKKRADEYYSSVIKVHEEEIKNRLYEKFFCHLDKDDFPPFVSRLSSSLGIEYYNDCPVGIVMSARDSGMTIPDYLDEHSE